MRGEGGVIRDSRTKMLEALRTVDTGSVFSDRVDILRVTLVSDESLRE